MGCSEPSPRKKKRWSGTFGVSRGMGIRARKNNLITALRFKGQAAKLSAEQVEGFELMYRRAKTTTEQDQVTAAVEGFLHGWKTDSDQFSRLLRDVNDFGDDAPIGSNDEDEDPPALREALARSRVTFLR